jgi:hypothetical protein
MKCAGQLLGSGKSRKVYEYLPDTTHVIKINIDSYTEYHNDPNQCEYAVFTLLQSYGLHEILAPCRMEDDNLIMMKTSPLPKGEYTVPVIFCDRPKNWGIANNKLYRIDYSWNAEILNNQLVIVKKLSEFQPHKFSVIADKLTFDEDSGHVIIPLTLDVLTKLFSTTMTMVVE